MTTTDRPAESPTKARYLTEEYEVFKDGRSYMCQKGRLSGRGLRGLSKGR